MLTAVNNFLNAFVDPIGRVAPKIPGAILALAVGIIVIHLTLWIIDKLLDLARTPKALQNILISIAQVIFWVILIAAIFQTLGLTQIALTLSGTLAIAGVAIGAGANAMVQDIISGLFLVRDHNFDVGMRIKTGDVEGTIKRIDIRKVRILDDAGNLHVLPNSSLDKASWMVVAEPEEPASSKGKK